MTENLDRRRVPVKSSERGPGPFPYYGASGVVDYVDGFLFEGLHLLVAEDGENLRSRATPVAFLADGQFWVNNHAHVLRAIDGNDIRYVAYALEAADISGFITGSAQPKLNQAALSTIQVPCPTGPEQCAIATTLGALDDKIESNRRIAEVSLDLAQATYEQACAAASDLVPLRDTGRWLSGGTPSTTRDDYWGGDLPWISAASLKDFFVLDSDRRLTPSGIEAATSIVPPGTVLMVVRGMSLKSEFRFGVTQRDVAFGQDCKAILPTIPSSILALALRASTSAILDLVDEAGHGTGRLATDLLERHLIAVPFDPSLAPKLDALLSRGAHAKAESVRLAALRDALLPELLSGRIRAAEVTVG